MKTNSVDEMAGFWHIVWNDGSRTVWSAAKYSAAFLLGLSRVYTFRFSQSGKA